MGILGRYTNDRLTQAFGGRRHFRCKARNMRKPVDNKSRGTVDFYDDPALDSNKLRDGAHIK